MLRVSGASVLALLLLSGLSGCGGSDSAESPTDPVDSASDSASSDSELVDSTSPDTAMAIDSTTPDSTGADSSSVDSSSVDSTSADSTVLDSTVADSAVTDSATADTSPIDTGTDLGPTCTDKCTTSGAARCQTGNEVTLETCATQSDGCLGWTASACPSSGTCAAGVCTPASSCTPGTTRCALSGKIEQCTAGAWLLVQTCAFGCESGTSGATCSSLVTCTPGTRRCNGNVVEFCNSAGTAQLYESTCPASCAGGLCVGACTPGQSRCNGNVVETCNTGGTAFATTSDCTATSATCDAATAKCAPKSLTIDATAPKDYDGVLVVDGPLVIKAGQVLRSPSGNLTIRAKSIVVEASGGITVLPTGNGPNGLAKPNIWYDVGGHGGGYGTAGTPNTYSTGAVEYGYPGPAFGNTKDAEVSMGGPGSRGGVTYNNPGGLGGGVLRLLAESIDLAGTIDARGMNGVNGSASARHGGGGGAGGGVLLAADTITLRSGATINTAGGTAGSSYSGCSNNCAGGGALGRIKILSGASLADGTAGGALTGVVTKGMLPPLQITSYTHPDPTFIYNDGFASFGASWNRAFPSREGYWHTLNTLALGNPPAPGVGVSFASATELASYDRSKFGTLATTGFTTFQFRLVSATSATIGTIENTFAVRVTAAPPTITIPTHPNAALYYDGSSVSTQWTFPDLGGANPLGDANWTGTFFLLDKYGDTMPGPEVSGSVFAPSAKKQQPYVAIADGVWVFHVVTVDQRSLRATNAAHRVFRVRAGASGTAAVTSELGAVSGTITVAGSPTANLRVSVNRGLFPAVAPFYVSTSSSGSFTITDVPAGSYMLRVQRVDGTGKVLETKEDAVTITASTTATKNMAF